MHLDLYAQFCEVGSIITPIIQIRRPRQCSKVYPVVEAGLEPRQFEASEPSP